MKEKKIVGYDSWFGVRIFVTDKEVIEDTGVDVHRYPLIKPRNTVIAQLERNPMMRRIRR